MSTFMEHIHRDTDTRPLFEDTALWGPRGYDLGSDNAGPVGSVNVMSVMSVVSEAPGHPAASSTLTYSMPSSPRLRRS